MNEKETISAVHNSMYHQKQKNGYATTVQVLIDLQILTTEDYEKWRFGRVDYLERICKVNLSRLKFILGTMQEYSKKQGLKESFTYYKKWGSKGKDTIKLRFSKSGNENVEKRYATHYVKSKEGIALSSDALE
ncbi:MAG: hypothetical protein K0R92_3585 [Lachnospiraceae bacterium]|jgi:hypothetical protein|nr:hypothetical protein [Lachnospiraceae bacterium]